MAFPPLFRPVVGSPRHFLALSTLLFAGVALLAGCHPAVQDPKDPKFIVAEKGNWQITRGELDKEIASTLKQHQVTPEQVGAANMPKVETFALKGMVLKKLILDRAATLPLKDVDKEEAAELDKLTQQVPPGQNLDQLLKTAGLTLDDVKIQIHQNVVIEKVLEAEAFKNDDPTEQEIDKIYLANKDRFNIPEKIRASRILVHVDDTTSAADKAAKKKIIDKARSRVVHGEDFSKVAMQVSEDRSSAPNGGDIGFFARNENEAEFDDAAFNTKENAISPVFLTPLGYQFLKVTAIQPAGIVPVADARNYVSSQLREQKMKGQASAYTTKLLADSGVTYHIVLVDLSTPGAAAGPGGPDNAPPSSASTSSAAVVQPTVTTPAATAPAAARPAATNSAPAK